MEQVWGRKYQILPVGACHSTRNFVFCTRVRLFAFCNRYNDTLHADQQASITWLAGGWLFSHQTSKPIVSAALGAAYL